MFVRTQPGCSSTDVTPSSLRSIDMDLLTATRDSVLSRRLQAAAIQCPGQSRPELFGDEMPATLVMLSTCHKRLAPCS